MTTINASLTRTFNVFVNEKTLRNMGIDPCAMAPNELRADAVISSSRIVTLHFHPGGTSHAATLQHRAMYKFSWAPTRVAGIGSIPGFGHQTFSAETEGATLIFDLSLLLHTSTNKHESASHAERQKTGEHKTSRHELAEQLMYFGPAPSPPSLTAPPVETDIDKFPSLRGNPVHLNSIKIAKHSLGVAIRKLSRNLDVRVASVRPVFAENGTFKDLVIEFVPNSPNGPFEI